MLTSAAKWVLSVWLFLTVKCVSTDMHPLPYLSFSPKTVSIIAFPLLTLPLFLTYIFLYAFYLHCQPWHPSFQCCSHWKALHCIQTSLVSLVYQLEMHLYVHLQTQYVLPSVKTDKAPPVLLLIICCSVVSISSFRCKEWESCLFYLECSQITQYGLSDRKVKQIYYDAFSLILWSVLQVW